VYQIDYYLSIVCILRVKDLTKTRLYATLVYMYGEYLEITTEAVMRVLGCSRQYVSELVKKERLVPSGKRGKSYTFRFSELSNVMDMQQWVDWVIRIDEVLMANLPKIFERRKPGWKVKGKDEVGK